MPDRLPWILLLSCRAIGALAAQPSAPSPIPAPLRELPWGQLNFLHTTDTHGWHGGHLQEPSFSADWGDYVSFAEHMRARADSDASDVLLVDTGDRIEGNGLFDASEPKGRFTYDIFKQQDIDLICSGNHELYNANSSNAEYNSTVPNFKGNYLATNLDIVNPKTGALEPLAARYKKFETKNQGIRILAFGFMYDFTLNANNTVVHSVAETIAQDWFQEAITDREIDLIVVFGHVPIDSQEYQLIYKTLRQQQWDLPLVFLGGHTHSRDYLVFDKNAHAIESGRYMETIGFMSISGIQTKTATKPAAKRVQFGRRYIDNNLYSLHHHSGTNSSTFPTARGEKTSQMIADARKELKLDDIRGCAPKDYFVSRAPYPHNDSIFSLLGEQILPEYLSQQAPRIAKEKKKAIMVTNTGTIRFDLLKGSYSHDTEFLVCPFTSGIRYIPDVPYAKAKRILALLNSQGPILDADARHAGPEKRTMLSPEQNSAPRKEKEKEEATIEPDRQSHAPPTLALARGQEALLQSAGEPPRASVVPGYTTTDDLGADGDDTVHAQMAYYRVPACFQAVVGFGGDEEPDAVDVAYNEFLEPWLLRALRYVGCEVDRGDTGVFVEGTMAGVITGWVEANWRVPESGVCE